MNSLSVTRVYSVVCIVLFILVGFPCRCCSFCVGIVVVAGVSVVVEVCCLFCCFGVIFIVTDSEFCELQASKAS